MPNKTCNAKTLTRIVTLFLISEAALIAPYGCGMKARSEQPVQQLREFVRLR
jgi:hypothetical protein